MEHIVLLLFSFFTEEVIFMAIHIQIFFTLLYGSK